MAEPRPGAGQQVVPRPWVTVRKVHSVWRWDYLEPSRNGTDHALQLPASTAFPTREEARRSATTSYPGVEVRDASGRLLLPPDVARRRRRRRALLLVVLALVAAVVVTRARR